MRILIGNKGNVDFSEPIKMTKDQREKFVTFMKSMFSVVQEEYRNQSRAERVGDRPEWPREWEPDEYVVLLERETTDKIANKLGRSWMSTDIKRGVFIREFQFWASEKGKELIKGDIKELIKEFLKEKQDIVKKRRLKKKRLRRRIKEIDREMNRLEDAKGIYEQIIKIGVPYLGIDVKKAKNELKEIEKKKNKILEERRKLLEKLK